MGAVIRSAILVLVLAALPAADGRAAAGGRAVAFTFDDLPATRAPTLAQARSITRGLLEGIREWRIPAVGFVNEGKLEQGPGETRERTELLEAWLAQGLELGNHTYSHLRLYDAGLERTEADVLAGERVTRALMASRGRTLRYFRHPTLNTGRDPETKAAFESFLAEHGYTVAPVTLDSDEFLYALAYERALARGDRRLARRLADDYLRYMEETFAFYERLSVRLLGREPVQVLLLHANLLNADHLGRLAAAMARRGYRFVSLEEALRDPAYQLPDRFVGDRGPSWLERWAITQGLDPGSPPSLPGWVQEATR